MIPARAAVSSVAPLVVSALALTLGACTCGPRVASTRSRLVVEPASVDFGQLADGESRDLKVTLNNIGTTKLALSAAIDGDASSVFAVLTPMPEQLAPGQDLQLTLRATGHRATPAPSAVLRFDTDSSATPEVLVSLIAFGAPSAASTCGNGVLDVGESCDPSSSCPTSCDDGVACTTDSLVGSAATCDARCTFAPISACLDGDGCCPAGCTRANDADCGATCGDHVVSTGETCDPPASCPTSCDDGNACTQDQAVGDPLTCTAACSHAPIARCLSGDGCCPTGCTHAIDADCPGTSTCGDGVVQANAGETCDPPTACPTSCDDRDACTNDVLSGSALSCTAVCTHARVNTCRSGDGCCPLGCTQANDSDCVSSGCGNGVCDPGETCAGCLADCGNGPAPSVTTTMCTGGYMVNTYTPINSCADALMVFGVYEPTGPGNEILVTLEHSSPFSVVLSSYSAVTWRIVVAPGAKLNRVIVSGYDAQTVIAPPGTNVTNLSPFTHGWLGCGYSWPYNGGGCDTAHLIAAAGQAAQYPVSTFTGCYQASEFTFH